MRTRTDEGSDGQLERLTKVLTVTPALLFHFDKDGELDYISPSAVKALGSDIAKIPPCGRTQGDRSVRAFEGLISRNRAVLCSGLGEKGEIIFPTLLGERWFEYDISPLFGGNGSLEGTVVTVTDIMDRKKMEHEMSESESKFRSFIEQSTDGVSLVDEDGRFIEWNKSLEGITLMDGDQAIGRYYWEVYDSLTSAEQRKVIPTTKVKEVVTEILTTGGGPYIKRRLEVEFTRADGEVRRTSQTIFPIKTKKGHRMGSNRSGCHREKNDRGGAQTFERRAAAVRLHRISRSKGALAHGIFLSGPDKVKVRRKGPRCEGKRVYRICGRRGRKDAPDDR